MVQDIILQIMEIKNVGVLNENRITNGKKGCKREFTMYSILTHMQNNYFY